MTAAHLLAGLVVALTATTLGPEPPADSRQDAVVRAACSACHAVPPPDILPRGAWGSVISDMAALIVQGVGVPKDGPRPSVDFDIGQIIYYYQSRAPKALPSPAPWPAPGRDPDRFVRHTLRFSEAKLPAAVANVRLVPA